jgi:hypothetical protein
MEDIELRVPVELTAARIQRRASISQEAAHQMAMELHSIVEDYRQLSTSAFGTTPIGLFPRPPTADRRAASPRIRAASPPTRRPSSPNFATLQSEPPTLRDIAAPNLATRSRECLTSVSVKHGFVPLSRRRQAPSMERS